MKQFIYLFFVLPQAVLSCKETDNKQGESSSLYEGLSYNIINIDTMVTHCVVGEYGASDFKEWDSTTIWADIILPELPARIDSISLKKKVEGIMKEHSIKAANVFRDQLSSGLFRLSSAYAAEKIKERDGYLGQFILD